MRDEQRLRELTEELAAFARERDWDQFHSPKNLAMALSVEASELVEIYQWMTQEESAAPSAEKRARIEEEVADIFIYLLRLADKAGVDLLPAVTRKIAANHRKYPADKVRGRSEKYTEYE